MSEAQAVPRTLVEKLIPGQTRSESTAMLGRGSLVFFGGMLMAGLSFVVEQAVIRKLKRA